MTGLLLLIGGMIILWIILDMTGMIPLSNIMKPKYLSTQYPNSFYDHLHNKKQLDYIFIPQRVILCDLPENRIEFAIPNYDGGQSNYVFVVTSENVSELSNEIGVLMTGSKFRIKRIQHGDAHTFIFELTQHP